MARKLTPEEEELERKRESLSARESLLADRELELASLHAELSAFNRRYSSTVSARYAKLDKLEARLAEILAQQSPDDIQAGEDAKSARERAAESEQLHQELPPLPNAAASSDPKSAVKLKSRYREFTKAAHPDLTTDEAERERRNKFMRDANAAYEVGDLARLESIWRTWQASPEAVKGEDVGSEWVRIIRKLAQIEERLKSIETAMTEVKSSPLAKLLARVQNAQESEETLFAQMTLDLDLRIALTQQRLDELGV